MGQYYNIATSDKVNGKITCHSVQVKGNDYQGVKLLEHSYYGNDTMNAVCAFLFQNPMHIAWVGDYSNEDERAPEALRKMLHKACWSGELAEEPWEKVEANDKWKFLVNHSKRMYIDLEKHFQCSHEDDTWSNGEHICIHPLSLLVAIGNGMGGGDYHTEYPNYEYTGKWAWDKISIEEKAPKNYKEAQCFFRETTDEGIVDDLTCSVDMDATMTEDASIGVRIQDNTYSTEYVDASWGEAYYYMLVQKDMGGDIPLAVDVGSNGRKNLEYMRDNEYSKEYEYAIVQISASEYFATGLDLSYDLFDLATDAVRNMGIKNNK